MGHQERKAERGIELLIKQLQINISSMEAELEKASDERKPEIRNAIAAERTELEKARASMQ